MISTNNVRVSQVNSSILVQNPDEVFNALQVDINDVLRDTVKYQVDRTTHSDRIRDFHKWMKGVQRDTEHNV